MKALCFFVLKHYLEQYCKAISDKRGYVVEGYSRQESHTPPHLGLIFGQRDMCGWCWCLWKQFWWYFFSSAYNHVIFKFQYHLLNSFLQSIYFTFFVYLSCHFYMLHQELRLKGKKKKAHVCPCVRICVYLYVHIHTTPVNL